MERKEKKIKNRRKGPDGISKTVSLIVAISWVLVFILFIIFGLAQPSSNMSVASLISRSSNTVAGRGWNVSLINILLPVLLIQLCLCVFGLVLSSRRMKRKGDRYSRSLIFFTITSIAGLLIYIILFV